MKEAKLLYKKYNYPVPRYTSYPPANFFKSGFSSDDYIQNIKYSNNHKPANVSIYIHIPFCKKLCHYCGCFKSYLNKNNTEPVALYVEALKKEILKSRQFIHKDRKLSQVHYGGGTPNAIPLEYIRELNELIFNQYDLISGAEVAIECNPAYIEYEDIDQFADMGFNRISLGIQDTNPEILKLVNREESKLDLQLLVDYIRSKKNPMMVNLDFIYGLPKQTQESFKQTIAQALELRPDRLVTFSYAHVPWVNNAQYHLEKIGLPEESEKIDMFFNTREMMKNAGYIPIGFDHYVLPDDELNIAFNEKKLHRNFQGYCTRITTGQVYAYGVSSISQLERAYLQNTKSTESYLKAIDSGEFPVEKGYLLNDTEILIREILTNLLSNNHIDLQHTANVYKLTISELENMLKIDYNMLKQLESDGIIILNNNSIDITDLGILFARNVAGTLDPNFEVKDNKYSKPV